METFDKQTDEIHIDIFNIIRDLIKDGWLILLTGLIAALCSYVITDIIYQPVFLADATLVVTSKGSNNSYDNLSTANSIAGSLTMILGSDIMKKKVALDIGTDDIPYDIIAEVIPETNLINLQVSASSPKVAYQVIEAILHNHTTVTDNLFKNTILDVMKTPKVPMFPINMQNLSGTMKKAFCIGAVAMGVLLSALSIMRDNIKNEKEILRKLDTRLFGVIYHENKYKTLRSRIRRKKKTILITNSTVSFHFVECFKKLRTKLEYKTSQKGHRVVLVTSVLENEGKSTVATNLALALAQKSDKVLLIDGDFSKPSLYKILQKEVQKEQEIGNCIIQNYDIKDAIFYDEINGIYLLIGSKLYQNSTDIVAKEAFQRLLLVTKNIMDYIIIDAPPLSVSADSELLSDLADASILVVKQDSARTKDINEAIDTLTDSKSELLGCVFNNVRNTIFGYRFGFGKGYSYKNYSGYYDNKNTVHSLNREKI